MTLANEGLCIVLLLAAVGVQGVCALVVAVLPFILGALALRWVGRGLVTDVSTEAARHKAYDAALEVGKRLRK